MMFNLNIFSIFTKPFISLFMRSILFLLIGSHAFSLKPNTLRHFWKRYVTSENFWDAMRDNTDLLAYLYDTGEVKLLDLREKEITKFSMVLQLKVYKELSRSIVAKNWLRRLWAQTDVETQVYLLTTSTSAIEVLLPLAGTLYENKELKNYIDDPKKTFLPGARVVARNRAEMLYSDRSIIAI